MLRLLVIVLLSLANLQAELTTRAYHLGKDQLQFWTQRNAKFLKANGIPEVPQPKPLDEAPFESPHFNEGDKLYNFKSFALLGAGLNPLPKHAIYNQTTGRIIVQGEQNSHVYFKVVSFSACDRLPKTLHLKVNLAGTQDPFPSITLRTNPGQEASVDISHNGNQLSIHWEAQTDAKGIIVESRLRFEGPLDGQELNFKTGMVSVAGVTQIINLGSSSPGHALLKLQLTKQVSFPGGLSILDIILDEHAAPIESTLVQLARPLVWTDGSPDPTTGRTLNAYYVPPTFSHVMGPVSPEKNPFAEKKPEEDSPNTLASFPAHWDPRIPFNPSDQIIDCTELLKNAGVNLTGSDFAIHHPGSDTLFVLTNPEAQFMVEGIARNASPITPRMIAATFQLIETPAKPDLKTMKAEPRILAQTSTVTCPGQTTSTVLGSMQLEFEAQIDADDSMIETRHAFQLVEGDDEPNYFHRSGLVYENGKPQIVQSTFIDGKWQSLVVTARILLVDERLKKGD